MRMPFHPPAYSTCGGAIQPTVSQAQVVQDSRIRPNRIKIVNPNTLEEVDYTGEEQKTPTLNKDDQIVRRPRL